MLCVCTGLDDINEFEAELEAPDKWARRFRILRESESSQRDESSGDGVTNEKAEGKGKDGDSQEVDSAQAAIDGGATALEKQDEADMPANDTAKMTENVAADVTPDVEADVKPVEAADVKPVEAADVASDSTPGAAADSTPDEAADTAPDVASDSSPSEAADATADVKPEATQNRTAHVPRNGTADDEPDGTKDVAECPEDNVEGKKSDSKRGQGKPGDDSSEKGEGDVK